MEKKSWHFYLTFVFIMLFANVAAAQPAGGTANAPAAPSASASAPATPPTGGNANQCSGLMSTIDNCKDQFCQRVQQCVGTANRTSTRYASEATCHNSEVTRLTATGGTERISTGAHRNNKGSCSCGEGFRAVEVVDMRTYRSVGPQDNRTHIVNRHYWCFPEDPGADNVIIASLVKNIRAEMKKLQDGLAANGVRLQRLEDGYLRLWVAVGENGRQIKLLWSELDKLNDRVTKVEERVTIVEGFRGELDKIWEVVGSTHEWHGGVRCGYSYYPSRGILGCGPEASWVSPNLWDGGARFELNASGLVGHGWNTRLYGTDGRTFELNAGAGLVFDLTKYSRRAVGEVPHHQLHVRAVYSQLIREDNDVNRVTAPDGTTTDVHSGSNHWPSWNMGLEVSPSFELAPRMHLAPYAGFGYGESGFRNPPGAAPREENPVSGMTGRVGLTFKGVF